MFDPKTQLIEAFVAHTQAEFQRAFPAAAATEFACLEHATHTALQTLLNCDCPYHDIEHTMLVTDVGQTILRGRQLARGDLDTHQWIQAVVAMLFHDIGYLRNLLRADTHEACVVDTDGTMIRPPKGATDAFMTPYHVTRGTLFVVERFANDALIDCDLVAQHIEMTRFPVPALEEYQHSDSLSGLVRAADLIGQMADPQYLQKLSRLWAEFVEIGEAERLGFANAGDLRQGFPEFFYAQVHPYIGAGVECLKRTQEGHRWIANLYHHLHVNQSNQDADPRLRAPELVVDNTG